MSTTISTVNLQYIINKAAGKKVIFFPHGTYLVSSPLVIPPGSRYVLILYIYLYKVK